MGKSIADLDRQLGSTLDHTGPGTGTQAPAQRTSVLAEKLRTKLKARDALPADPGTVANTVLVEGKLRYGGSGGPVVVARRHRPEVPQAAPAGAPSAPSGPTPLVGLTPATEMFLNSAAARRTPAAAIAALRPGHLHHRPEVPAAPESRYQQPTLPHLPVDRSGASKADLAVPTGGAAGGARAIDPVGQRGAPHLGGPGAVADRGTPVAAEPPEGWQPGWNTAAISVLEDAPVDLEPQAEVEDPPEGDPPNWPGPYQFVTGPAGCGKTFLARQWGRHDKGFLLCATTGIAAVNLGDAVTIHSTLKFFDTDSVEESFIQGHLQARMRKLRASGVTRYGIDEVSMMPARVLTTLTNAVEELNSDAAAEMGHEPKIGITLIGDFLQLPPVKEDYAFLSPEWPKYEAHMVRLTGTYRQADPDFIRALRAVRVGEPQEAMDVLASHIQPTLDTRFDGTTILSKNQQVDRFNKIRHQELEGTPIRFKNTITGTPLKEWERHIPMWVDLKPGAKVMILANRYLEVSEGENVLVYANGDTGTFVEAGVSKKVAYVELNRSKDIVPVGYNIRQNLVPTGAKGKKKDRYSVLGEIEYMPLRLAYASSVHKCVSYGTMIGVSGKGLIPIEQAQLGDWIDTGGATFARLKATAHTEKPAVRFITTRGVTVVCSPEHRWKTAQGMVEARKLKGRSIVNAAPSLVTGTGTIDADLGWWLGVTVGDGSYNDRRGGQLNFTSNTPELRNRWMKIAQRYGGSPNTRRDKRGCHLTSLPFRLRLEMWGLDYVTALSKRVPHAVFESGPVAWGAFLGGLFDADGSVSDGRLVYATSSPKLAQDILLLLDRLGIRALSTGYNTVYHGEPKQYWHVRIPAHGRDLFRARVPLYHPGKRKGLAYRPNREISKRADTDQVLYVEKTGIVLPMLDVELETVHEVAFGCHVGSNSQGLTLDEVQVDISDPFFTAPAMVYVALSRARSLEGLRLVGNPALLLKRCTVDPRVERWR